MQRTDIEWAESVWNPITGCFHDCDYCYARRIAERFGGYTDPATGELVKMKSTGKRVVLLDTAMSIKSKAGDYRVAAFPYCFTPTFHRYRLDEPKKATKPKNVFVGSMCDLFGEWIPDEWIQEIFTACQAAPWHRYLFLTKNSARYTRIDKRAVKDIAWFGTTVDHADAPIFKSGKYKTFVSMEPLMRPPEYRDVSTADWIIVGALTGHGAKKKQPERKWVDDITGWADERNVPVYMKDSLLPVMGEANMRREFPWKE